MVNQQAQWEEENADEDDDEMNGMYSELQKETRQAIAVPKFMDALRGKAEQVVAGKNAVKKDPFLKYGIGIQNFFQLQRVLCKLYAAVSVLAILQMIIYRSHAGLSYLQDQKSTLSYFNLSFASMGFATNNCGKAPIGWERNSPVILYF